MAFGCSCAWWAGSSPFEGPVIQLQILSVLFALTMLYWSYLSFRRGTIRLLELGFWTLVWTGFAFVVIFPNSTALFLEKLRVNRTMDLFTVLGFIMVWVLVFMNHLETRRLQKRLQELVRQLALREGNER